MTLDPDKLLRLEALLDAIFEDRAGTAEYEELEVLLRDDPDAQREYLHRIDLHHAVRWQAAGEATYRSFAALREARPLSRWVKFAAAAAALFLAILIAGTETAPPAARPTAPPVAVLMDLRNAEWREVYFTPGAALPAGPVKLARGTAELEFTAGARLLLQGPAHLDLAGPSRAFLHRGTATVETPPGSEFHLGGPGIEVSNEGSEFGLHVDGEVRLTVLEGEVEARVETPALQIPQTLQLTREESLHLDRSGTLTANIIGAPGSFARLGASADPEIPRIANGGFEYPRAGAYRQLAAAGWRLEVHPLANLENMPVETGAGVIGARERGLLFTGPAPAAPEGRQWGFLNTRTFPDGRTYHTSMHQAVGRVVPGATYVLTATLGRPEGAPLDGPTYTLGLYAGTPESGPAQTLQEWSDPALPAPGQTAMLKLFHRVPEAHPEAGTVLYLRIATVPGTTAGVRQILIDDIRLERAR